MKKIKKLLFFAILIFTVIFTISCDYQLYYDNDVYMADVLPWKNQRATYSGKNEVELTVTEDIDYLYWTKSNGEILYTDKNYRFMPYFYSNEKLSFEARKEPYVFDFTDIGPGEYVLDIHYKDTSKNSDNDFRGKVYVTQGIAISDKDKGENCGHSCRKMGKATLQNDSQILAYTQFEKNNGGNVINEYYYAEFVSHNKKKRKTNFFKIIYKINITLKPGESKVILLPIPKPGTPNTESGLIAYPVVNDGKVYYFGKMVDGIRKDGFTHPQDGQINFDVEPIGNNMLSCSWN